MYGVVDANNNSYRNIITDPMRMNQSNAVECLIIDEEPNVDATKFFFYLLNDYE